MPEPVPISEHTFDGQFVAAVGLRSREHNYALGSRNQLILGDEEGTRPWKGLQSKGANTGSRKMCTVGATWGGLKDNGGTQGAGSLFEDIGRSRWFIGAGIPSVAGTDLYVGALASTTLKVAIAVAGVYDSAHSYSAGLPQPSAPDVAVASTPGAGLTGLIDGPVSFKLARLRLTTGARSVASTTSAVVVPSKKTVRVTFPAASTGQDYWRAFVTQQGFGGVGLHYALPFNGSLDISEATVAASSVDGVARSIEFDFKDGDLVDELAYRDDYAPPAGTHAVRLANTMNVLGCYGDSSSAVSSTSTGTCGAVSLPNFYESYKPRNLVYFPDSIVDVLGRQTDDYAFVLHKTCVTTLQYVGLQDGPACVVNMAWPDVGVAYGFNATQAFGRLFAYVGKGGLVRMKDDGSVDYEWAAPIRGFIKDWTAQNTVVGFHPDTLSVVAMNGGKAVSWSFQTGKWSTECRFADAGVTGSALSCATAGGELVVTVNNGGSHTAYSWDAGASTMPVTSFTNWKKTSGPVNLSQLLTSFECDRTADPVFISAHRNLRKTYAEDASVTSASNVLTSASFGFNSAHTGDMCVLFGTNVGGAGVNYMLARLTYASATTCSMTHPTTGATLNAQASASSCYVIVGYKISSLTLTTTGPQHTPPLQEFYVPDCVSHCVGVNMITSAGTGQVFSLNVEGTGATGRVGKTT
jgi:hypothetical protein